MFKKPSTAKLKAYHFTEIYAQDASQEPTEVTMWAYPKTLAECRKFLRLHTEVACVQLTPEKVEATIPGVGQSSMDDYTPMLLVYMNTQIGELHHKEVIGDEIFCS